MSINTINVTSLADIASEPIQPHRKPNTTPLRYEPVRNDEHGAPVYRVVDDDNTLSADVIEVYRARVGSGGWTHTMVNASAHGITVFATLREAKNDLEKRIAWGQRSGGRLPWARLPGEVAG